MLALQLSEQTSIGDEARANRRGAHRPSGVAGGQPPGAGEANKAEFRCAVGLIEGHAQDPSDGGNVDDMAAPAFEHAGEQGAGQQHGTCQVDRDGLLDFRRTPVIESQAGIDAGVVHQDVDASQLLDAVRQGGNGPWIGHVGNDVSHLPAGFFAQRRGNFFQSVC